jgi:hypothetical protein
VVSCGRTRLQLTLDLLEGARMAAKKQQTHAKRARELAVKERRERKAARKAERLAAAAEGVPMDGDDDGASEEMPEDGSQELPADESTAGMAPVEAR